MSIFKTLIDKLMTPEAYSLKRQSMRAAAWSVLEKGTGIVLRMVGSLLLTRLLFPEAFGLMATAMIIASMIQLFTDTGVRTAIIQNPRGAKPTFLNTAWIISLCRGGILFCILAAASWPISFVYDQAGLQGLMLIMAFNPLILGFENPAMVLVIKNFRVEKQVALELGTQVLGLLTSLVLAVILRSAYALAFGAVLSSLYRVIGSYFIEPYRPQLVWNKKAGGELYHFGKFVFINTMVSWATLNADILIIGKLLGMDPLGVYHIGRNIGGMATLFCLQIFAQSYMPAVSSVSGDISRIVRIYKRTSAFILTITIPASLVLALFSNDIIRLLYDPRYQQAAIAMYWICISGIIRVIHTANSNTFLAMGHPVYETFSSTVGLCMVFLLIPMGVKMGGLAGGASAMVAVITIVTAVQCAFLIKRFNFPASIVLGPWLQVTLVSGTLYGFFVLVGPWMVSPRLYNLPMLLSTACVGAALSIAVYFLKEGRSPFKDQGGARK